MLRGYHLGCPGWAVKEFVGRLYPEGTRPTEYLARYAEVFNAVEGNTTFYALPHVEQVARWREQVPPDFRFCFKFPREVSHDKLLVDAAPEVAAFVERVAPLGDRLGTLFVQLPAHGGPAMLPRLRAFLAALPRGFTYAAEVRHDAFFRAGAARAELVEILRGRGAELVMFDARGVHASHSLEHADVRARKPNLPVLARALTDAPFARFVPHEDFAQSRAFAAQWAAQLARWIADGKRPYFFVHAPDDAFAPENAYAFHALLREQAGDAVGELPPWPGGPRQLSLV